MLSLLRRIPDRLWRLVITPYRPDTTVATFLDRAQMQHDDRAAATVAVLTATESRQYFGVDLARRGIQPVFLRITNRSRGSLRVQMVDIDPRYFTPLEAAALNHFSILRRLSAFGAMGWVFLPLVLLVPLKLVTAHAANKRMDDLFRERGFRLGPIPAGETAEGFVFASLDLGTKVVRVRLNTIGSMASTAALAHDETVSDFTFTIAVPGIAADYLTRDFDALRPQGTVETCTLTEIVTRLEALPAATTNAGGTRRGDPVNLVVIAPFETLLSGFAARWDESESISLATCWKTVRAFLLGSSYRYSPVSSLHLFGRPQDIALQRTRRSINERLHLRLWLTPLDFQEQPVWVGQVSRDIGVRFTTRAWNLTTHRIDPDVDEARDYVIEDLLQAGRVTAAGYVGGVGSCDRAHPRRNLTGDPYHTDGNRAVILLATSRTVTTPPEPSSGGTSLIDVPHRPEPRTHVRGCLMTPDHDGSLADVLRSLLVGRRVGALATLHDGRPFASMIPFALIPSIATAANARLRLVTHVSGLAAHTRDMRSHPEVCLLVTAPESSDVMPQALPRVSLSAVAEFIPAEHPEHAALKAAYLAKFPEAADFFMLGDFSLVVLEPVSARLVAGFARAVTLGPAALAAAVAERPG